MLHGKTRKRLLALSLPSHDANVSFFDGERLRYIKLERWRQVKRYGSPGPAAWRAEIADHWPELLSGVDDVVLDCDPAALPPPLQQQLGIAALRQLASGEAPAIPLSPAICHWLGIPRGWFISHHLAHALSGWMMGDTPPDLSLVVDGIGDGKPWSLFRGDRLVASGDIRQGSLGWGMREAGKRLGVTYGHYNDIAGKVMGLQAWGRVDSGYLKRLRQLPVLAWRDLWSFELWQRWCGDPLLAAHTQLDWVATVHQRSSEVLLALLGSYAQAEDLIHYSGGVAQNVVWNSALRRHFPGLMVPPHASDEGLSLGSMEWLRRYHNLPPLSLPGFPWAQADESAPAPSREVVVSAARLLAAGQIVGWYQGHGEIGPRALGGRSLLMDARLDDGKSKMNQIKRREGYRPYGAAVLADHFSRYFGGEADGWMLYASHLLRDGYRAITHVDGSCRVQLVKEADGPLAPLLKAFYDLTGSPVLLNTSLNLAGQPIAATTGQARRLFDETQIDAMVIGDELLLKPTAAAILNGELKNG
jgi:carbamoyltransferase